MQQLRHYSRVIKIRLWLILLGIAICSSVTFGISKFVINPVYQASSLIQVNGSLTLSTSNDAFNDQAFAVSDALLITGTSVLQEVAKQVPDMSLSQLELAVSASPQANSQIIEVRAQAGNPKLAADIANTVVNVFIQQQVDKANAPLKKQDTQLSQDLLATKVAIDQAQTQLTALEKSGASVNEIAHQNDILTTYQANYNSLLADDRQVQLQESQAVNALSVEQLATFPDLPSSPRILLNTVIAAALGLLLMIVLALLLDWLDTSIQTPDDVSRLALLEPLGSVPFSEHPLMLANPANPSVASDDTIKQTFMTMGISFSALGNDKCTVLVTSLRTGAGVSTTATNLAISFAQLGNRVLLVDANLNQPSLHEIFHCPNTRGLVNSLADVYQFRDGIIQSWLNFWRTNIPNLWLLPTNSQATHPPLVKYLQELRLLTDWLLRKKQDTLGGKLPGAMDIIIFDAPALSEGTDAMALASVTDCSVLVVQAGKERKEMVSKAGITLQRLGSPVLGVVVNRQTTKHRPYYYTNSQQQNFMSVGSSSLEDARVLSLLTRQTLSPNTPPSLPQVNHWDGLNGQSLPLMDEVTRSPVETIIPTTPWSLEQSRISQFKGPGSRSS